MEIAVSKGENQRQKIFDKYSSNLNLLNDLGFVFTKRDIYICPICLQEHDSINGENPLTLEDAPPKSLGGKAHVLTCKSCNNTLGHSVDVHLAERLNELERDQFLPGSTYKGAITIKNETFQATINVNTDGTIEVFHSNKNNNPSLLEAKMNSVSEGDVADLNFLKSRVIPERLEYALLKTAYLLMFEKLGYSLILDGTYQPIRDQLLDPTKRVYPEEFWFVPPENLGLKGVNFVLDKKMESLLVCFKVSTGKIEREFGVFLPLPINKFEDILQNTKTATKGDGTFTLELYPSEKDKLCYLFDENNIAAMYKWLKNRNTDYLH